MVHPSHCPGCKILKSEHTFGKPGKSCQGMPDQDDTFAASGSGLTTTTATPDSLQETLASLVGAVQAISQDLESLKAENKHLRAKIAGPAEVQFSPSSALPPNPGVPSQVTLPELRDMKDLVSQVDTWVSQLGLLSESSDESYGEEDLDRVQIAGPAATGAKPKCAGKLKSGKEARVTCTVRYPLLWPHSQLMFVHNKREICYKDLTIEEFVAGYGEILQTPHITEQEKSARLRHLVSLMYFAQQYKWHAVLSFHGVVLLKIEHGLLNWVDSFIHLESYPI